MSAKTFRRFLYSASLKHWQKKTIFRYISVSYNRRFWVYQGRWDYSHFTERCYINFGFTLTPMCVSTVYSVLPESCEQSITGILLGWDSNPSPLQLYSSVYHLDNYQRCCKRTAKGKQIWDLGLQIISEYYSLKQLDTLSKQYCPEAHTSCITTYI